MRITKRKSKTKKNTRKDQKNHDNDSHSARNNNKVEHGGTNDNEGLHRPFQGSTACSSENLEAGLRGHPVLGVGDHNNLKAMLMARRKT